MFTDLSILTSGVNIYKHENSISGEQRDLTSIGHLEYEQAVSITVGIQNTDSNCSYHLGYMYAVLITVIAQNTGNRIWSDFVDHLKKHIDCVDHSQMHNLLVAMRNGGFC